MSKKRQFIFLLLLACALGGLATNQYWLKREIRANQTLIVKYEMQNCLYKNRKMDRQMAYDTCNNMIISDFSHALGDVE